MGEKPTAATVLSAIGGVFIFLAGLLFIFIASVFGALLSGLPIAGAPVDPDQFVAYLATVGAIGAVIGIVIIVLGVMMFARPAQARIMGVIVLILSILSFFFVIGGFFIGGLLALIGGILGIVFKPTMMQPMMAPPMAPPSMPPP